MTLGNLENEVIFKKAFTDKTVFKGFVRDVLGIDVEVDKIETEKKFTPQIGYIDFELDIFAETTDKRIVIEIQRVEYDSNFDRFLHYFLMVIAEQQKRSKAYGISQTVYVVVILTAPYTINQKNGQPIKDEVLLLTLNSRAVNGEERDLYGHQFVCLNPSHSDDNTPQPIRDWLDLIYQSIHNPERAVINRNNEGIRRAAELISFENLTPVERALKKNKEAAQITVAQIANATLIKIAKASIQKGYDDQTIADSTELPIDTIEQLRRDLPD
jgi:PD-(D/E)XK nuclease family transposase